MYYLDLNLTHASMVSLAKALWDIPDIKLKIKRLFAKVGKSDEVQKWYSEITKSVLNHSKFFTERLSGKLKCKMDDVIVFIGEEIYSWIHYILDILKLDYRFAERIFLTPFGTVDESQIFQKFWLVNPQLFDSDEINYSLFELALIFVQEDFIFDMRDQIIDDWKKIFSKFLPKIKTSKEISKFKAKINDLEEKQDVVLLLLTTWINLHFRNLYFDLDENLDFERIYNLDVRRFEDVEAKAIKNFSYALHFKDAKVKTMENDMLAVCLNLVMIEPCKYFIKKNPNFAFLFVIFSCIRKSRNEDLTDYEKKKYLELVLFVINRISDEGKLLSISQTFQALLNRSFNYWPYQKIFLKLFSVADSCELLAKSNWQKLLMTVAKKDRYYFSMNSTFKINLHRFILKQLWEKTSEDVKNDKIFYEKLIGIYFRSFDFSAIKILITFDVKKAEFKHFGVLRNEIKKIVTKGIFFSLEKFLNEAFDGADNRELFKFWLTKEWIKGSEVLCLASSDEEEDWEDDEEGDWEDDEEGEEEEEEEENTEEEEEEVEEDEDNEYDEDKEEFKKNVADYMDEAWIEKYKNDRPDGPVFKSKANFMKEIFGLFNGGIDSSNDEYDSDFSLSS